MGHQLRGGERWKGVADVAKGEAPTDLEGRRARRYQTAQEDVVQYAAGDLASDGRPVGGARPPR